MLDNLPFTDQNHPKRPCVKEMQLFTTSFEKLRDVLTILIEQCGSPPD